MDTANVRFRPKADIKGAALDVARAQVRVEGSGRLNYMDSRRPKKDRYLLSATLRSSVDTSSPRSH